jgi:hypothetical protein
MQMIAQTEYNMPLIVLGDYDVPFTLMPLDVTKFKRTTREGFFEVQTLMTACLAIELDAIHPANNDNDKELVDA